MADYIEREAVIDELDEWKELYQDSGAACDVLVLAKRAIRKIPAADVRPVALCKDCKWTKTDGMEDPAIYCEKWDRWEMPPDGFCWLGKKRKETTDGN